MQKNENIFVNISFNVLLPVIILNKAAQFIPHITPITTLLIALACPFFYGLRSYLIEKKINWISVIGLVGVLLTGGFAVFQLKGILFAIKEAAIPLIFGLVTVGSVLYKKPFMNLLIKSAFDKGLIFKKIEEHGKEKHFSQLMNRTTIYFAGSLFLSALLNFFIAKSVFKETESLHVLNEQIATMTWLGYVVIAIPLSVITGLIIWHLITQLTKITGLSLNELISKDHASVNENSEK